MTTDPIGPTLELLHSALRRFVTTEMSARHGAGWELVARTGLPTAQPDTELDLAALLQIIEKNWPTVFVAHLSGADRGYVSELRGVRNQWVHERPFAVTDAVHALDIAQRLLQSMGAPDEARVVSAQKVTLAASVAVPAAPTRAPRASAPRSTLRSTSVVAAPKRTVLVKKVAKPQLRPASGSFPRAAAGIAPDLAPLAAAFIEVCGPAFRTFGATSLGTLGICNAVEGVQWSAALDRATGRATLSVNLEGMEYDGWPIARLIERELQEPSLPSAARTVSTPASVTLSWVRDCWQVAGRLRILEQDITPTPLTLDRFTPGIWREALTEARTCLDAARNYHGRAQQAVTLVASGETVTKAVSPHLQFTVTLQRATPGDNWEPALRAAKAILAPLHAWTTGRAQA